MFRHLARPEYDQQNGPGALEADPAQMIRRQQNS
jgi:hypothetical protein